MRQEGALQPLGAAVEYAEVPPHFVPELGARVAASRSSDALDERSTQNLWLALQSEGVPSWLVRPAAGSGSFIPELYPRRTPQYVPGSGFWFRMFNPSVGSTPGTMVKLGSWSYCRVGSAEPIGHEGGNETWYALNAEGRAKLKHLRGFGGPETRWPSGDGLPLWPIYSAYMRNSRLVHLFADAADSRLFTHRNKPYAIFSRLDDRREYTRVWLASLDTVSSLPAREMPLRWAEADLRRHQRNWSPLPYSEGDGAGYLYVSYSICPHVVLRCDVGSGECAKAFETYNADVCGRNATGSEGLRGGSLPVALRGVPGLGDYLIAVAHTVEDAPLNRYVKRQYSHRFVLYDATPPFAVRSASEAFSFPAFFQNEIDSIQYCAGMALQLPDEQQAAVLTVSYGVGDCVARTVQLPLADVVTTSAHSHPSV